MRLNPVETERHPCKQDDTVQRTTARAPKFDSNLNEEQLDMLWVHERARALWHWLTFARR